jgi:lipopolysaccharide biosynthesis glycosyltransferase
LSFGINEENKQKMHDIVEEYRCKFVFIDAIPIMKPIFEEINLDAFRGSYATYARAFISYLAPDNIDNLLYIDSDTIVDGSLIDLVQLNLLSNNKIYAAVIGTNQYTKDNPEIILDNGNNIYYQAGVIFFNLTNWRQYNCSERIKSYIKTHGSTYRNADQTIINNVIEQQYVEALHPKFNYWGHIYKGARFWYQMKLGGFWNKEVILDAKCNPVIIHYKGHIVHPWKKNSISPLAHKYQYYKSLSPWHNEKEYSIYYDFDLKKETPELRKKYDRQILNIRLSPFLLGILYIKKIVVQKCRQIFKLSV